MSGESPVRPAARGRSIVVAGVLLIVVLVYVFRLGTGFHGWLRVFYYSYFSDIVIPFYMYFVMFVGERRVRRLRDWRVKALLVFGISSLTEVLQAFGVPLFGRTFDPLDFPMFAAGTLLAVLADRLLLERFFPGLPPGKDGHTALNRLSLSLFAVELLRHV